MNVTISFNDDKIVVPAGTSLNDFLLFQGLNYSSDKSYLFNGSPISQHSTLDTSGTLQSNKKNVTGN